MGFYVHSAYLMTYHTCEGQLLEGSIGMQLKIAEDKRRTSIPVEVWVHYNANVLSVQTAVNQRTYIQTEKECFPSNLVVKSYCIRQM